MEKQSHGYVFVSQLKNTKSFQKLFKRYLKKSPKKSDKGKNHVYKFKEITLILSTVHGKLTIYSNKNKFGFLNIIRKSVNKKTFKSIQSSIRQIKREYRVYNENLPNKKHYCDYHILKSKNLSTSVKPSPRPNLYRLLNFDALDMRIVRDVYLNIGGMTINDISKHFSMDYHTIRRRVNKLAILGLLDKIGENPALFDRPKNEGRAVLTSQLVGYFFNLLPMANLQEM